MQGYRGTRDFLPVDWRVLRYLFGVWRRVSESYGFVEYEAPVIEPVELFTLKSGDEIKGQLFWFKDKGGRSVCLRAELTPQLARYVVQYGRSLKKPLKWFSIPRLFRYERPQRGRFREFFQFNVDVVGSSIYGTIEVINLGIDVLRSFGLRSGDIVVKLNDRVLINELISRYNISRVVEFYSLLDKRYKLGDEVFFRELKLVSDSEELLSILKLSGFDCFNKLKGLGFSVDRLERVFKFVDKRFVSFDLSIVRGLDYYTGVVWEAFDRAGEFRALLGGGEYEDLVSSFGGGDVSCVGFGMGDAVIIELLKSRGLLPVFKSDGLFIATVGDVFKQVFRFASRLRRRGVNVFVNSNDLKLGKQLSLAESLGYSRVLIIGERDLKSGKATLRNLVSGKERRVKLDSFAKSL